jgi:hypothetical protein
MIRKLVSVRLLVLSIVLILPLSIEGISFRIVRSRRNVKNRADSPHHLLRNRNVNDHASIVQLCALNDQSSSNNDEYSRRTSSKSEEFDTNHVQQFVIQSILDDPYRYSHGFHSPLFDAYDIGLSETNAMVEDMDLEDDDDINVYCGVDEIDCEIECMIPDEYKQFSKENQIDVMSYLGIRRA